MTKLTSGSSLPPPLPVPYVVPYVATSAASPEVTWKHTARPANLPVTKTASVTYWDGPLPCPDSMTGYLACASCATIAPHSDKVISVRAAAGTAVADHYAHDVTIVVPGRGEYTLASIVADWLASEQEQPATPDGLAAGTYRRRLIGDMPDTEALQALRDAGVFVMLYGPPGGGKSRVVQEAFPDRIEFCGDGDTTYDDLVGSWTPSEQHGTYIWADGPLVTAMREGKPFFFDDCALVSPKVAAVLYPVLDGRAELTVKTHMSQKADGTHHPETVTAQPGFWCVAAWNPGTHGSVLSEALASRFAVHIQVETDYDVALRMGLDKRLIHVARNLRTTQDSGAGWVPQMRELLAFAATAAVLGEKAAIANLLGQCPKEDQPALKGVLAGSFGAGGDVLAAGKAAQ
jgi:nitric oxide reductase NorQ protein